MSRAGMIPRCTGVLQYTLHGMVHDTQYPYHGTLLYAIAVDKPKNVFYCCCIVLVSVICIAIVSYREVVYHSGPIAD